MSIDAAVLSFLFNGLWAGLLLALDKRARQSPFLLAFALALGMTAAVAVIMAKTWFDPGLIRPAWVPVWLWRAFIEAGLLEEGVKAALLWITLWAKKPKDPMKVFLIAVFVGIGFALTENMTYILRGAYESIAHDPETYYRTIISVAVIRSIPTHATFTGLVGFATSLVYFWRRTRRHYYLPVLALFAAAFLHGGWNALPSGFFLEKYFAIMTLLVAMSWASMALSQRLKPSFIAAWDRGWIRLVPLEDLQPRASAKLETLLAGLAAFVYSLFVVNLLVIR